MKVAGRIASFATSIAALEAQYSALVLPTVPASALCVLATDTGDHHVIRRAIG